MEMIVEPVRAARDRPHWAGHGGTVARSFWAYFVPGSSMETQISATFYYALTQ